MQNGRDPGASKWITTNTPKASLHPKVMLRTWWHWKGVLYYELFLEKIPIRSTESSTWQKLSGISQQKMHNLLPGYCKTKETLDNQEKTVIACLGSFDSSTIFVGASWWRWKESEKAGLKLNIQKTKIMASGPITSWQIDGETMETVRDFIFLGSKITADGDCSHEIKRRLLLGRRPITN